MTKEEILEPYVYEVSLEWSTPLVVDKADALEAMSAYIAPLQAENEALRNTLKAERERAEELSSYLSRRHFACLNKKTELQADNERLRKEVGELTALRHHCSILETELSRIKGEYLRVMEGIYCFALTKAQRGEVKLVIEKLKAE